MESGTTLSSVAPAAAMAAVPREAVFRARGLSKVYRMGEVAVHPLRSVNMVADGVRVSVDKNDRKVQ